MSPSAAPRLIASDLDGTLLRSDGTVSPRAEAVLRRAVAAGCLVVAVTGRPVRWMHPVAQALQHEGLAVCSNGAVVMDLATESVVEARPLGRSDVLAIAAKLRLSVPGVCFGVESLGSGFGHEPLYRRGPVAGVVHAPVPVAALEDLAGDDVVKLLALAPEGTPEDFLALALEVVGGHGELTHSTKAPFLEISAPGVTKASTVALLAKQAGLAAADAIAFGDMPNDLGMLAWAARSVATANAHPLVLAAASEVAGTNDEDGVAEVLERFFPPPPLG